MKIKLLNQTTRIKKNNLPLVIGYFGCIHVMHNEILNTYHEFNVLTFRDSKFKKDHQIYNFNDRINNLGEYHINNCYVYDIDHNNITAQQFVDFYLKKINPSVIVAGADLKIGSDQKDVDFLKNLFHVDVFAYHKEVSSKIIYEYLKCNDLESANAFLIKPYFYKSKWIPGRKRGRKLGYKTINIKLKQQIVLQPGVFVCKIIIGRRYYKGVAFYGASATFNNKKPTLEVHAIGAKILPRILHLPQTINNVKVEFLQYLRQPIQFSSKKELCYAIQDDISAANNFFKNEQI